MAASIVRIISLFAILVGAFSAADLAGASPARGFVSDTGSAALAKSCATSDATYELQMGPGGDFAGATVVRVEQSEPASTVAVMESVPPPGERNPQNPHTATRAADHVIMGPGGDFAGATVVHTDDPVLDELAAGAESASCS